MIGSVDERDREWGVRLADVRLPRAWPLSVFGALLLVRRQDKRQVKQAERIGRELAESVVYRWQEGDALSRGPPVLRHPCP